MGGWMNIILLSGGSGKRLWPLSNEIRSKQFLKLFKNEEIYESMVQRVYRQIKSVDKNANILISTLKSQVSALINQLGDSIDICIEPCRRDTFPAIVLSAAYMYYCKGIDLEEPIIVCPVDPYVGTEFFVCINTLTKLVEENKRKITLIGIEPTYPSEKYGYIIPMANSQIGDVKSFNEKPSIVMAEEYISQGALWNAGVFGFKLSYILDKAHSIMDFNNFEELLSKYGDMEKISFDYAILEKEDSVQVLRFSGMWKDIGTWNTLTEEMTSPIIGKGMIDDLFDNTYIINELNIPILCMGMKDTIVAASNDGILVSSKERSSYIKPFVEQINQEVMFAEKSWGVYRVIDIAENSMTIRVTLNENCYMNYHSHNYRDEVWTVICGTGVAIVDGKIFELAPGKVINIENGAKHTVIAKEKLEMIEIQIGNNISVHDKEKYEYDYSQHIL